MKIEFYDKESGEVVNDEFLFVMNNEVYANNNDSYESQPQCVYFETFIKQRLDLGWRVV